MSELVSVPDAAESLGLTEDEVYGLIGTGDLEVTIDLGSADEVDPGGSVGADPDGARAIARIRISRTVLSAFRRTQHQGVA